MSDDLSIPNPGYRGGNQAARYSRSARPRRGGMDSDTRRLIMFAGGVGGLLALLIAASALTGHRGGQLPVVYPDASPIRVKPENPGGLKVDAAENDVFSGGSDTSNARLAPAAEAPDPKALRDAETPPAPAVAPTPPAPVAMEPPATSPAPPETDTAAPARVAPPVAAAPSRVAPPTRLPTPPAPAVAATPSLVRPVMPPAPQPHTEAHPATAAGHTVIVQLAAMTSEDLAKEEWLRLSHRLPGLFGAHTANLSKTERDGHVFWRLRTGGFADINQAHAFCEQVRAKGGNCSIAEF